MEEHAVTQPRDLERAIKEADWERLLPRLANYAERRLRRVGWGAGQDNEPSRASVMEVVNTAIERCLDGRRNWTDNATDDLEMFLCGAIKSVTSSAKKAAVRDKATATEDAGAESAHGDPLPDELLAEHDRSTILAAAAKCVEDDEELQALYLAILEGHHKPAEIAELLGASVSVINTSRIKLQRRLVAGFPELFAKYKQRRGS